MKTAKLGATIALLLFVGATVGMLIAQEVSRPGTELTADDGSPGPAPETVAAAPDSSSGESSAEASTSAGESESTVEAANDTDLGPEANEGEPTVSPTETVSTVEVVTNTACVIEAIYFHNTFRCVTCLKIEGDAKAIVEEEFAEELAAGKLRWSTINMEENRSYISQYDLASPSLVLIRKAGDEVVDWITLDDTWSLIRSETRFAPYIVDSFQAFLEGCP